MSRITGNDICEFPPGRIYIRKNRLPRNLTKSLGIRCLGEADFELRPKDNILIKVILAKNQTDLRKIWRAWSGERLPNHTDGFVSRETYYLDDPHSNVTKTFVDKNYYAIMGLSVKDLRVGLVAHECVHAGIAYIQRNLLKGRLWSNGDEVMEEELAYPVGKLNAAITAWIRAKGYDL